MVDVLTEITINKPILEVFEYAANPDNAPEWYVNIKSAKWISSKPLQTGTQIAFVAHFLGKELVYTYEIIEFISQEKMVMKTAEGPFPMETTYNWVAINENTTKMTLRNAGKPSGFSKFFAPIMAKMMKKANTKDLQNIKRIIEKK